MDLERLENKAKEKIEKMLIALKEAQSQAKALGFRIEVIDDSTNKPLENAVATDCVSKNPRYGSLSKIIKEAIAMQSGEFTVPALHDAICSKYPGIKIRQASIYNNLLRRVAKKEITRMTQGGKGDPSTFKKP